MPFPFIAFIAVIAILALLAFVPASLGLLWQVFITLLASWFLSIGIGSARVSTAVSCTMLAIGITLGTVAVKGLI